jgi:two-component system LytT family sensor kinase
MLTPDTARSLPSSAAARDGPDRAWTWTRAVLVVGPPLWTFVLLADVLGMEAWRYASSDLEIAAPAVRALQYLILLPFLLLACRAAVAVGYRPPRAVGRVLVQVALCAGFAALGRPALALAAALLAPGDVSASLTESLLQPYAESLAVWAGASTSTAMHYLLCLGAIAGLKTYRDLEGERVLRAEMERQAAQARLHALKNQLNPHFLFNALNTVVALIESDPRLAQTLVTRISELLRRIVGESATSAVTLRHELDLLERYLAIQELRFPQRLTHRFDVTDAAARALVPPLVVQPLLENAVLHGLAGHDGPVHVALTARLDGDRLAIVIVNPGSREPRGTGTGVGLANVAERLRTLFGTRASVDLARGSDGQWHARLVLPRIDDARPAPGGAR